MKNYLWWRVLALVTILLMVGPVVMAEEPTTSYITNPEDGETVSGVEIVTGTADFYDFLKYEVMLKRDDDLIWVATGFSPVVNGNLARFDTKAYHNGSYQLILRLVRKDSNYTDVAGPSIVIDNPQGAPNAHPEVEPNFLYPNPDWALVRIRNCASHNVEFDYKSFEGFCSADDLWLMPKEEGSDQCNITDLQLIPGCTYRGTVVEEGAPEGLTYSFEAEAGKIYEIDYPGGVQIFINEVSGDERTEEDTGGDLDRTPSDSSMQGGTISHASPSDILPVSGQGQESKTSFIFIAIGLILFLIVGGFIAMRKRKHGYE